MTPSSRSPVALVVSEQGVRAVQAAPAAASGATRLRTAEIAFGGELSLDRAEQAGKALRDELRRAGIAASRCVIGLSAAWTAARHKQFPPADGDSLRGAVALAAEREFAAGTAELAMDFLAEPSAGGVSTLLLAAPRKTIDQVTALARGAALTVQSITSAPLALARVITVSAPGGRVVVCLGPGGTEVVVQDPGESARQIRHVPAQLQGGNGQVDLLVGELRRVLAGVAEGDTPTQLAVWDISGAEPALLEGLSTRLGRPLRLCRSDSDLACSLESPGSESDRFVQAAALACTEDAPAVDFLHSRLAPPRTRRLGRPVVWGLIAAGVLLLLASALVVDHHLQQQELDSLQAQVDQFHERYEQAERTVADTTFARGWFAPRPSYLDCLLQAASAFPAEGYVWASSFAVREDLQVIVSGKAVRESAVLEVVDRLRRDTRLCNVKSLFIRQAGGTSRDVSFAISYALRRAS